MRTDKPRPLTPTVRTTRLAASSPRTAPRTRRGGDTLRVPQWGHAPRPAAGRAAPARAASATLPAPLQLLLARRGGFPWLVFGAIALLLLGELAQVVLGHPLGPWRDVWPLLAALLAAGAAVVAALTGRFPLASPWVWFASGCALWAFGALARAAQGAPTRTAADPLMLADLGFLGCAVLLLGGMAAASPGGAATLPRLRLVIDALLLPGALGLLIYLLVGREAAGGAAGDLHVLVWAAYLALYMAVAFGAALSYRPVESDAAGRDRPAGRTGARSAGTALTYGVVLCFLGAVPLAFSTLWPQQMLPRLLADVAFLLGFALVALEAFETAARNLNPPVTTVSAAPGEWGAQRQRRRRDPLPALPLLPWWPSVNLPLAGTIVAFGTAILGARDVRLAIYLGSLGLLGLVVGRQLITLRENERLIARQRVSGELEARLREVGLALNRLDQAEAVLERICEAGKQIFQADTVILWRADARQQVLEAVAAVGNPARNFPREGRRLDLDDDQALATRVFRNGKAERIDYASRRNRTHQTLTTITNSEGLLAVPLMSNQQPLGVLVFGHHDPEAFRLEDEVKAELLAAQAAVSMETARRNAERERRLAELEALHDLSQATPYARTASDVACALLEILRRRLDFVHAAVYVTEGRGRPLVPIAVAEDQGPIMAVESNHRPPPSVMSSLRTQLTDPTLRKVVASGERARLDGGKARGEQQFLHAGMQVRLTVPLKLGDHVLGVADLESDQEGAYQGPGERTVVSLAAGAALRMQNIRLFEEARQVETLRELDRVKNELLQTVSHELKTPLASIKGFTTTLMEHDSRLTREEKFEFLEIIDQESDRLRGLIDDLLDMSKIDAGVLQLDLQAVSMAKLVAEAVRAVASHSPEHRFEPLVPDDLLAEADPRRIRQVLHNLLENAVKYSPDGGVIRVGAYRDDSGWLVLSVRDQGIGIPRQHLGRVFDRFHRVDSDVGRNVGGSGLGLAICRGVVEAHGGRIWVESNGEGQGSEFSFSLPLALGEPRAIGA